MLKRKDNNVKMKIGLLFPGQGSQYLGMGKDLYDEYEEYRDVYKNVKDITGIDVKKITFEEDEFLNQTKYTQIAILTMSLAILEVLNKKINLNEYCLAGLSLGEYTALIRGNSISFEDGVKIVSKRGELMQDMCPKGDWAMAAVMGLEENELEEVISEVKGFVKMANFNTVGQIVVSGDREGINELIVLAKEKGAKRVIELNTSGPFHTEKLENAADELRKELDKIDVKSPSIKVFKNIDGKEYSLSDDMKDILKNHIVSSVRFSDSINEMIEDGVDTFIEIGPGKTLTGFVKRINKDVTLFNINDKESLNNVVEVLNGGNING